MKKITKATIFLLVFAGAATAQEKKAPEDSAGVAGQTAHWMGQFDKNKDGKVAKDETGGLMARFFDRNDTNKDGFLDKGELDDLAKRLKQRGGQNQGRNRTRQPRQGGMRTEELLKNAPDSVKIVPDISYREGASERWKLDLVMPKAMGEEPRPGIVFVHGGGWRQGNKRSGTFLNGALEYAQKGYVCITVNYRLTDEAPFPACVEDVKNAVRWFRAHAGEYNLDPERIGAYGNSAGAHLVSMLGLVRKDTGLEGDGSHQDESSLVQAVCASATPTDFNLFGGGRSMNRPGALLHGPEEGLKERVRRASPITYVRKDAPPFLLVHGTTDTTVAVKHSDSFVEALKEAGAEDVTYIRVDGAGHGVFNQHKQKTGPAMEQFFARTLGKTAP